MFEAFKIGIKLSLANEVSAGLLLLTGQFARLDQHLMGSKRHLSDIERQFARIKTLGLVGGALTGVGALGLAVLKGPIDAAKEYETAYTRFKTLNLGDVVNQQADKFARGTQAFGASSKDLMETLRESVGMFGGMPNALKIAPVLAELNAANSFLFGSQAGKLDEHAIKSLMRFNDMRGLTDSPQDFMRGLDLAQKMFTGSGGMIKFGDLEMMAKRGGAAFKGMSDDGIMMMSSMLQENGGNATGTAIMSLYQNLVAGRTPVKTMRALADAGLVTLGQVHNGTVGGKGSTATVISGVKDERMLRENPALWLMTYGTQAAKEHGAKTDSETISFMNNLLSNRTGSNMGALFTTQSFQALRDFRLAHGAMGTQDTIEAGKKTTVGREAELRAKNAALLTELGLAILPAFNKGLDMLISLLKAATSFAHEFPTLTKGIMVTFGVLAGLTAAGGALMMATAGFAALNLALGGGAAGGAGLVGALGTAGSAVGAFAGAIGALAVGFAVGGVLSKGIDALLSKIRGKETSLGSSIYDWLHPEGTASVKGAGGFASNGGGAAFGSPHIRGGGGKTIQVGTTVNLDGRAIAKVVTNHQEDAAQRPATGGRRPDGSMSALGAGATATGSW